MPEKTNAMFGIALRFVLLLLMLTHVTVTAQQADVLQLDSLTARPVDSVTAPKTNLLHDTALKTNLLYDAALIPNLGVEIPLARQWTLALDGFWAWWSQDSRHRYWQGYGGYVTLRRYFSPTASRPSPFTGHHLGIYALGMTYDVEWGGRGYQAAKFGFGGGIEYGYSLPIARRLCLDFSIGLGFQDGEYKEYVPQDGHYVWQSTHKRHWWGPTKAEVSLVWRAF